jgi:hypothetical protein
MAKSPAKLHTPYNIDYVHWPLGPQAGLVLYVSHWPQQGILYEVEEGSEQLISMLVQNNCF